MLALSAETTPKRPPGARLAVGRDSGASMLSRVSQRSRSSRLKTSERPLWPATGRCPGSSGGSLAARVRVEFARCAYRAAVGVRRSGGQPKFASRCLVLAMRRLSGIAEHSRVNVQKQIGPRFRWTFTSDGETVLYRTTFSCRSLRS